MLVSFVATLAPAVLDIVVQVSNSVAVNKIAQGDKSIINNFSVFRKLTGKIQTDS